MSTACTPTPNIPAKAGISTRTCVAVLISFISCFFISCGNNGKDTVTEKEGKEIAAINEDSLVVGDYLFESKTKRDTNLSHTFEKAGNYRSADSAATVDKERIKRLLPGRGPNPYSCFYSPTVDKMLKDKTPHDLDSAALWKIMNRLNEKELLYFCTAYPCQYAQICSMPPHKDEKLKVNKYLPAVYEGYIMSHHQKVALLKKRTKIIELLTQALEKDCFSYNDSFFRLLEDLNAWELIPFLFKKLDNNYTGPTLITLAFRFMNNDSYQPITKNPAYARMYLGKEETSYPYSVALFNQVKIEALKFYQSKTNNK